MCEIVRGMQAPAQEVEQPPSNTPIADAILAILKAENDVDLKCWLDWTFVRPLDADALRIKRTIEDAVRRASAPTP